MITLLIPQCFESRYFEYLILMRYTAKQVITDDVYPSNLFIERWLQLIFIFYKVYLSIGLIFIDIIILVWHCGREAF